MKTNTKILNEVKTAYADCTMDFEKSLSLRNLNFKASAFVKRDEAREILGEAIPEGYNAFNADLLDKFPAGCRVQIAREGSVCLYVEGKNLPSAKDVLADERHVQGDITRFWYD